MAPLGDHPLLSAPEVGLGDTQDAPLVQHNCRVVGTWLLARLLRWIGASNAFDSHSAAEHINQG